MKILFAHGKESGPWGSKAKAFNKIAKAHGCTFDSINYQEVPSQEDRVVRLSQELEKETNDVVLCGSSMGGYVSLLAAQNESKNSVKIKGVFLVAPALYMPGYAVQNYKLHAPHNEIVHGWSDEVVPVEGSIRLAKESLCTLHLINGDHRLVEQLETITSYFDLFLRKVLG